LTAVGVAADNACMSAAARIAAAHTVARSHHDAGHAALLKYRMRERERLDEQARIPKGQSGGGRFTSGGTGGRSGPAVRLTPEQKMAKAAAYLQQSREKRAARSAAAKERAQQTLLFKRAPKKSAPEGGYTVNKVFQGASGTKAVQGIKNKAMVHAKGEIALAEHKARKARTGRTVPPSAAAPAAAPAAHGGEHAERVANAARFNKSPAHAAATKELADATDLHTRATAEAEHFRKTQKRRDLVGMGHPNHIQEKAAERVAKAKATIAAEDAKHFAEHGKSNAEVAAVTERGKTAGALIARMTGRTPAAAPAAAAPAPGSLAAQWKEQGAQRRAADLAKAAKNRALEAGENPHLGKKPAQLDTALERNAKKLSDLNFRIGTSSGMHETPEQALARFATLPISMGPRKLADEHAALTRERGHLHEAAAAHGGVNEYNQVNTPHRQGLKRRGEAAARKVEAENAAHEAKQKADKQAAQEHATAEHAAAAKAKEQASFQASRDSERARERMKHDHSQKSAAQINKQIERASAKQSANSSKMIAAGLGHETAHETADIHMGRREAPAGLNNPGHQTLRAEHVRLSDERFFLHAEVARRAGPGMSRLPRGFGPIGGSAKRKKAT